MPASHTFLTPLLLQNLAAESLTVVDYKIKGAGFQLLNRTVFQVPYLEAHKSKYSRHVDPERLNLVISEVC